MFIFPCLFAGNILVDARYLLLLSFALGCGQVTCKLQVLLLNFVRQDRKTFRKKINFSLLREHTSKNFTWYPMNMTFSISAGRNRHYTLCCVSQRDHSLWEFWVVFPSNTVELYTCVSWSALSWIVKGIPRSKHFLISWLQSPSVVILKPRKIKSDTVSTVSPSISRIYPSNSMIPSKS